MAAIAVRTLRLAKREHLLLTGERNARRPNGGLS
jgi:hypothetical protein